MPRQARMKSESGIYHIIMRGINRQIIFKDHHDSEKFLNTLKEYKDICGYKIYAYCLMGNHVHILIHEGKEELGLVMKRIGASYVFWYNWKYQRCGHLFQGRFKSEAIDNDKYFLTALRYIHQNPLKAGLVKNISDYKWSSYNDYVRGKGITDIEFTLGLFSSSEKEALKYFMAYNEERDDADCLDVIDDRRLTDDEAINVIRKLCDISNCFDIKSFEITLRDSYLKDLKREGLSTRQIAKLTGVNRNAIIKA